MYRIFDPKPDFPKLEEEILKFWEDNKIFKKSLEKTLRQAQGKKSSFFTFYDGPPFATGTPHYGHILASTIKDVFPRYQTMKGNYVRRRWGWDCHGLPIEEIVERKLGISGKKQIEEIGIKKFNETCKSMVLQYASVWRKTVRRIARWIEFDNSYKTMDRDYMESVWWAFKNFYDKGLVYEGRKVLLYCPRCETPISNFEVAMDNSYKDLKEETVTVKFKVKNPSTSFHSVQGEKKLMPEPVEGSTYLLAWTTTPWTLPGNVALAVGEDIEYVKIKIGESFYIVAAERLSAIARSEATKQSDIEDKIATSHQSGTRDGFEVVQKFKGSDLIGLEYEPLFDVSALRNTPSQSPPKIGGEGGVYKVYPADFVTTEDGTGIVHTAVVYGEEDYELGQKVGLPVVPLLDEKGKFNAKAPKELQGMDFKESESFIKKDLETRGLMFSKEMHIHSYPHCWRCDSMLFYNAIPAWFVNIQKIKKDLIKSNEKEINWYPDHLKRGRYEKSVEAAPDWNISRNRYWGNPIPVWKCQNVECGNIKVVGSIKELGLGRNEFYFARHAESTKNVPEGIINGVIENDKYDLTKNGEKQAKELAKQIKKEGGVDLIFTSPFLRTKHTAEFIAKELGIEVLTDDRLWEFRHGEYEGRPDSDLFRDYPDYFENRPKGAETKEQLKLRMLDFVSEINKKYEGKRILVVSHADPIWVLMEFYGSEKPYPKTHDLVKLDVSIADLHRPYIDEIKLSCDKCGGECARIPEIFDSWVEAGSMPFAEFHYPFDQKEEFESRLPAQFVAEYIAQTRAWFYVMHVISLVLFGKAPFENVVTTGTILAEDGSKMSKSKNNFPDPWLMIDKFGVDALRFYLMNSVVMQADNLNFSENTLATVYRKNILILWNVFSYFITYANEAGWEPNSKFEIRNLKFVLDKWIVAKTQSLINEVTKEFDSYNTVKATRLMEEYINELSTWYLRRSRGRKDTEFFATLRHCLLALSKVMAPVTPYISELIYQTLNLKADVPSVHLAEWLKVQDLSQAEQSIIKQMDVVRQLVEDSHSKRKANNIKLRQPLGHTDYFGYVLDSEFEQILADETNVEGVSLSPSASLSPDESQELYVNIDFTITPDLKIKGLTRELERAIQGLRKNQGLKVGEIVDLEYDINDEELAGAMEKINKSKSYISKLKRTPELSGEEFEIETKKVILKISKV